MIQPTRLDKESAAGLPINQSRRLWKRGFPSKRDLVQFMRQVERRGVALLPVLRHGSFDNDIHFPGKIGAGFQNIGNRIIDMLQSQTDHGILGKGPLTRQHLVKHCPQPIDIGAVIHVLSQCLFRAQVGRCPNDVLTGGGDKGFGNLCHAKIGKIGIVACIEQYIIGLDIAMDNPSGMGMIERRGQAFDDQSCIAQGKLSLFDHFGKRPARHIAHDKEWLVILVAPHVIDRHNGRMFQRSDQLEFTLETGTCQQVMQQFCGKTLIATSRLEMGSKARYTVAIPPRPSSALILYLPTLSGAM